MLLEAGLALGCPALIVDVQGSDKSSYKVLTEVVGGTYLALGEQDQLGFSPFFPVDQVLQNGKFNEERVNFLTTILLVLAVPVGSEFETYPEVTKGIMQRVVQDTYEKVMRTKVHPILEDFVATLEKLTPKQMEHKRFQRDMFLRLEPYLQVSTDALTDHAQFGQTDPQFPSSRA
ncbi:MAG: hypothetical protein GY822_23030 [Deltaproteobacteria bacterium]|nr:hypothetical protein [Deltaproteobacteria bacterium]